jgi:hypothetical protein
MAGKVWRTKRFPIQLRVRDPSPKIKCPPSSLRRVIKVKYLIEEMLFKLKLKVE